MFTITNEECLNLFEKYLVEDKKASANTLSSYMRDVRQLAEYLGANGIIDATAEELDGYISSLRSTGKSVATVSRTIASIKCLYSHLFIKQLITLITPAIKYPHAIELYSRSNNIKICRFSRPCRGNRKIWQLFIRQFLTFLQEICGYLIAELITQRKG